jgi:hypothetical protein
MPNDHPVSSIPFSRSRKAPICYCQPIRRMHADTVQAPPVRDAATGKISPARGEAICQSVNISTAGSSFHAKVDGCRADAVPSLAGDGRSDCDKNRLREGVHYSCGAHRRFCPSSCLRELSRSLTPSPLLSSASINSTSASSRARRHYRSAAVVWRAANRDVEARSPSEISERIFFLHKALSSLTFIESSCSIPM